MKVSKIFGFVLCLHFGIITVLIVQPGCRTAQPPTQTYKQDGIAQTQAIRTNVKGATRASDGLIEATRTNQSQGSSLDAAFNAGIESGNYSTTSQFAEFDDVAPLVPIQSVVTTSDPAPIVSVAGPSSESYTIKKGDSLWALSKRYNVSLNELYAANGLNKNSVLRIGQQIQIPGEGGSATVSTVTADTYQPTSFNTGSEDYTVKRGDTLSKIAVQFDTSVRAIKAANNKTSDMIRVGEKLVIPVGGNATSSSSGSSNTNRTVSTSSTTTTFTPSVSTRSARTHTVTSGEFPATIARKYGMTSGELLALNGITDPRSLQVGQVLQVSASGSAANVDTKTETVVAPRAATNPATTSFGTAPTPAPVASNGPVAIRVVEADPLIEDEAAIIDVDSQFNNAVEIPVIRLEE